MPKFSFKPKRSNEFIKSVEASTKEEAIKFFAKIKVLDTDKFNNLYEVIER